MAVPAPVSRTRMEVFMDALRHNFEAVRFLAGRKRDIIAVIMYIVFSNTMNLYHYYDGS